LKGGTAVEVNSAALLAAIESWDRNVDGSFEWIEQLPKNRGGAVAENGSVATGEHRGHEAPVEAQASVSYGVDALVDAVESAARRAFGGRRPPEPYGRQLLRSDHTMLLSGDFRDAGIERVAFVRHFRTKATGLRTRPPYPAIFRALWSAEKL
jgi:hypothetical protein